MFNFFKKKKVTLEDKICFIEKNIDKVNIYNIVYLTNIGNWVFDFGDDHIYTLIKKLKDISHDISEDSVELPKWVSKHYRFKEFCSNDGHLNKNVANDILILIKLIEPLYYYYKNNRVSSKHSIKLKPYIIIMSSVVDVLYDELN